MRRPSFATVIALLALVMASSGTAYAVTLGPGSVRGWHIENDTIKSRDVRDGTLRAKDLAPGVLPEGVEVTVRTTEGGPVAEGESGTVAMFCRYGELAIGGGVQSDPERTRVTQSRPHSSNTLAASPVYEGWLASVVNEGPVPIVPRVWVVCASGVQAAS